MSAFKIYTIKPLETMEALSLKLRQWCSRQPGTSEAAAFSQDCSGLLGLAPTNPGSLGRVASGPVPALAPLVAAVSALKGFLHEAARVASRFATRQTNVVSPYIGGVVGAPDTAMPNSCKTRGFSIGTLNPGRSGLLSLHTHEVIWWRLIRIANKLVTHQIDICFLPAWRWPPGVEVPEDLGFRMLGTAKAKWASIGALVSMRIAPLVHQLDAFMTDRTLWLAVNLGGDSAYILGGFYAAPGGDIETWSLLLQQFEALSATFPGVRIVLAGDANAHFSKVVRHESHCNCLHCKQSPRDRQIEAMVAASNLAVLNDDTPTHDSGTLIDLILGTPDVFTKAVVHPETIGGSDHRLVTAKVGAVPCSDHWQPDARVQWSHGHLWSEALSSVQESTQVILSAVDEAICEVCETPTLPVKRRRAILDAAAWCREVLVAVAGHLHGLVAVTVTKKKKRQLTEPVASHHLDNLQVSKAVAAAQLTARQKFAALCAKDPAKADSFLSGFFNRSRRFEVSLVDEETQKTLGAFQTAEVIAADMSARANNQFPVDDEGRRMLVDLVSKIRAAGAPPTGVPGIQQLPSSTTAQLPTLYSQDEFRTCLTKICASKKSVHAPLAAVKAGSLVTDSLALQLCNLGRACGLTAAAWSTRHISPIRKAGPQLVTSIANLRPVSRASDMSAIQDALWLSRCKPFIERYTGECQLGGRYDCIAIIVALVLHAQVRHYQGLLTYFLFCRS